VLPLQIRPFLAEADLSKYYSQKGRLYSLSLTGNPVAALVEQYNLGAPLKSHFHPAARLLPFSAGIHPQKHLCVHFEGLLSPSLCLILYIFTSLS